VLGARLIAVTGKVQSDGNVIHVIADRIEDRTGMLAALSADATGDLAPLARADEVRRDPGVDPRDKPRRPANHLMRHPRNEPIGRDLAAIAESTHEVMPKGRNFH
jgi:error-prone DNA polymerase